MLLDGSHVIFRKKDKIAFFKKLSSLSRHMNQTLKRLVHVSGVGSESLRRFVPQNVFLTTKKAPVLAHLE